MNKLTRSVDVTVFHTEGCAATPPTIDLIKDVAQEMDIPIHLSKVLIQSPEQASELKFLGSPTVQVNGLDIDPANIRICRAHRLPVRRGSIYELPYEDAAFDTCVFMEVLEHLHRPAEALAELVRVTRPGGRVLVVYPVDRAMYVARILCGCFKAAGFDPAHVRQWNARDLKREMREAGLHPVASKSMPLVWPFKLHGLVVGERR